MRYLVHKIVNALSLTRKDERGEQGFTRFGYWYWVKRAPKGT